MQNLIPVKNFVFCLIFTIPCFAETGSVIVPSTRGNLDTAYVEWDSFTGINDANATGTANSDFTHNFSSGTMTQTASLAFPGGVKFTTATDRRIYTFDSATDWTLAGTSTVSYNKATLQTVELLSGTFGNGAPVTGLTSYNVTLNGIAPTTASAQARTETITIDVGGTPFNFDRSIALTTFTWELPTSSTTVSLNLTGPSSSHDSIDAFVLDLETIPSSPPTPEIFIANNQVTLSWPSDSLATLKSTTNLSDPNSWQNVNTTPVISGNNYQVTIAIPNDPTFFRLES